MHQVLTRLIHHNVNTVICLLRRSGLCELGNFVFEVFNVINGSNIYEFISTKQDHTSLPGRNKNQYEYVYALVCEHLFIPEKLLPICLSISAASSGVARGMTPGSLKLVLNKVAITNMNSKTPTNGIANVISLARYTQLKREKIMAITHLEVIITTC